MASLWTLILVVLVLLLISPSNAAAARTTPLSLSVDEQITGECEASETDYYDLCVSSLKSDPQTYHARLPGMLPNISMSISLANATAIHSEINITLSKKSNIDPVMKESLEACLSSYDNAIHATQYGIQKFPKTGVVDPFETIILGAVVSAMGNITYCEDGLKNHTVNLALLPKIEISRQLSVLAYDLIMLSQL